MNQSAREITRIGAYGIICRDSQILLCRLSDAVPGWAGRWTLPGGGLEFGEHPEAGMVREVFEETGYRVEPGGLLGINSLTRRRPEQAFQSLQIVYRAEITGGVLTHEMAGTTDQCQWHDLAGVSELPQVALVAAALDMLDD